MTTKTATNGKSGSATNGNTMKEPASKKTASAQHHVDVENDSRLQEFFHDEVKDIYWAEKHLVKTLPKMHKAASSTELKEAFAAHLDVTRKHVERLEEVFSLLEKRPNAKKCEAMEGITKEGESIIEETEAGTATRDVGLIMAAQKVEHYEIATYGGLTQLAKTLGYGEIANLLQTTLDEEKEADEGLTKLAEGKVNKFAASEG
ncbi:ferritin-like domain-containing protein [Ferruginibacter sp.]|uniref:YciE/YciF ferroxidase family protein n=1 Tax=Ferruginibacter sp. TaxID=1940288 RepID=UPI002659832B|nr:ferritin-like domain-containing protein [Ferruginibacter sp.]